MKKRLLLGIALLLMMTLSACSTQETPEEAVNNALTAFKEFDEEKIEHYFGPLNGFIDPETGKPDEGTQLIIDHLEFKTLKAKTAGTESAVETEITNVDMLPIMEKYFQAVSEYEFDEETSEEEMRETFENLIVELLSEDDLDTMTTVLNVQVVKVEDEWKISLDEGLMNALLGRFDSAS